jgi:hypothetical protein
MDPFAVTARGPGGQLDAVRYSMAIDNQRSVASVRHCALVTTATTTATGWAPLTVQPLTVQLLYVQLVYVDCANVPALLCLAWS